MKPKIEDIITSKENQDKLDKALKMIGNSYRAKKCAIVRFVGSVCCKCDNAATKKLIYQKDGFQIVERYCDNCIKKINK